MRIVVTTSQSMAGVVEKIVNTINISPFDTTPKALIDAKGDLLTGVSAGVMDNLSVGTDGHVLIADSAQTNGVKWGIPSSGGAMSLYNNDASDHAVGTVVVMDLSIDYGVIKTTSPGNARVYAVAVETVASGTTGLYAQSGQMEVLVQGNVSRGQWLICSSTSGRAAASTSVKPYRGVIGIAQTEYTGGGAGSVMALVNIEQLTSSLQQLATLPAWNFGTATSPSMLFTIEPAANLLVVRISAAVASISSVTFGGVALTQIVGTSAGSRYAGIWGLIDPPVGTFYVIVSLGSSVAYNFIATSYTGAVGTGFRTPQSTTFTAVTSVSLSSTASSVGDIVIDCGSFTAIWTPTAGQTNDVAGGTTPYLNASKKPGSAATTTTSWSGASASGSYCAVAIAGS